MSNEQNSGCGCTFGLGSVAAAILSAALNPHNLLWWLLHFALGWFYVLYAVAFRTKEIVPAIRRLFL